MWMRSWLLCMKRKNDKEHPDWFVSDDEEYVRTHIEKQGFVIVAQTADGSVAGFLPY